MIQEPRKVLFIAASGIGNTILATPMIQAAKSLWPDAQFDLLTSRKIFQAPVARSNFINHFFDLEQRALGTLFMLRRKRYDISITCFPSNRWQFNFVAGMIGAKLRVTHRYDEGSRFSFLMNHLVPADDKLHDIEQNLTLFSFAGGKIETPPPSFALNDKDHQRAAQWIEERKLTGKTLVGVHVGGANHQKKSLLMNQPLGAIKWPRREDLQRDLVQQSPESRFIFFGGAEENDVIESFIASLPEELRARCYRFSSDIWATAALVSKCHSFFSGDTVFMHLAAVFGLPQKAYFMATNPIRTAPRNSKATLVIEKGCENYRYPFRLRDQS